MTEQPRGQRHGQPVRPVVSPWPFVGMAGMAGTFFPYAASGLVAPPYGVAVLMVEQRARQALAFSDRGYILDSGRIVLTDTGQALLANQHMSDLYIGRGGHAGADRPPSGSAPA